MPRKSKKTIVLRSSVIRALNLSGIFANKDENKVVQSMTLQYKTTYSRRYVVRKFQLASVITR